MTDISELETTTTYEYTRHPSTGAYLETVEFGNATARSNWVTGTNENKSKKSIDFITADKVYNVLSHSDPNDCVALYYDNINADPKILIEFELINLAKSNVETGDIIQIENTDITPFGKAWADLYFMVYEIVRAQGNVIVRAREVYEA